MTEAQWLASDDPVAMLNASVRRRFSNVCRQPDRPSDRKLRLFACACFAVRYGRAVGEVSNWSAWKDGEQGPDASMDPAVEALAWVTNVGNESCRPAFAALLRDIVGNPFRPLRHSRYRFTGTAKSSDSFIEESWLTPTVLLLAWAACEERGRKCETCRGRGYLVKRGDIVGTSRFSVGRGVSMVDVPCDPCRTTGTIDDGTLDALMLMAMADALEEAGCPPPHHEHSFSTSNLLDHLRSPDLHYRGCWAVDLILGKS